MSIEKAVDEVKVAGTAATCARGKLAGQLSLRAGCKRAASSWRTWIHLTLLFRRRASVTGFRLSPTTP